MCKARDAIDAIRASRVLVSRSLFARSFLPFPPPPPLFFSLTLRK